MNPAAAQLLHAHLDAACRAVEAALPLAGELHEVLRSAPDDLDGCHRVLLRLRGHAELPAPEPEPLED